MIVLGELLGGELVELDHLFGQILRIIETFRIEHDFGDHRIVRDHHSHCSEEDL